MIAMNKRWFYVLVIFVIVGVVSWNGQLIFKRTQGLSIIRFVTGPMVNDPMVNSTQSTTIMVSSRRW